MKKTFTKYLISYKNRPLIVEAPEASNSLLGGKTITIPRDGAHAGQSGWQSNNAWDVKASIGDPVYAIADGTVITLNDYGPKVIKTKGKKLFGAGFTVKGSNGSPSVYYTHLQNVQISKGDKIKCGQLLGFVMDFPGSSYDHVHIGIEPGHNIRNYVEPTGKIKCTTGKIIKSLKDIVPSSDEEKLKDVENKLPANLDLSQILGGNKDISGLPIFTLLNNLLKMQESKKIELETGKINHLLKTIFENKKNIRNKVVSEATFGSPKQGDLYVTSPFGARRSYEVHPGVDLRAKSGSDLLSPADGIILTADMNHNKLCGGTIDIQFPDGFWGRFCHIKSMFVKKGDKVKKGDRIGLTGGHYNDPGRGNSKAAHIHFTLKKDGKLVDPMNYINKAQISTIDNVESDVEDTSSEEPSSNSNIDLNLFKGLPIFDLLSKLLSMNENHISIDEEIEKVNDVLRQIEKETRKVKKSIEYEVLKESFVSELGDIVKIDGKSAKIKINRLTTIYSPQSGQIRNNFTNTSCDKKIVLQILHENQTYYLEYCGLKNTFVSNGDSIRMSQSIANAESDVTVSVYNSSQKKVPIKDFITSTEKKENKKKEDKPEGIKWKDPLMSSLLIAPFKPFMDVKDKEGNIIKKNWASPTGKEQPSPDIANFFKKWSPTAPKKLEENLNRIKKLLK